MMLYRVVWSIEKALYLKADSKEGAKTMVEDKDCVLDGDYVDDSFEIVKVEEVGE